MNRDIVTRAAQQFRKDYAPEMEVHDAFPAWYLYRRFGVTVDVAKLQASDPGLIGATSGDRGLDAFHFEVGDDGKPCLHLVQAKFSESVDLIAKGIRELGRSLNQVAAEFTPTPGPGVHNKLFTNLRHKIREIGVSGPANVQFELTVLHLSIRGEASLKASCRRAIEEVKQDLRAAFPDSLVRNIRLIGPPEIDGHELVSPAGAWTPLRLPAETVSASIGEHTATMHLGVGYLSDLVDMYERRRDDLFSKNVRYFLRKG